MFALLFSLDGRIARSTYLCVGVGTRAAAVGLAALGETGWLPQGFTILSAFAFIAFAWISFAAGVKRLHDQNRRGWWLLLEIPVAWLIYGLCAVIFYRYDNSGLIAFLASSLLLGRHRGTPGANRFGPKPGSLWQRFHGQEYRDLHGAFRLTPPPLGVESAVQTAPPATAPSAMQVTHGPIRTHPRKAWSPQPLIIVIALTAAFVMMAKAQMVLHKPFTSEAHMKTIESR